MRKGGPVADSIAILINDFTDQVAYNGKLVNDAVSANSSLINRSIVLSITATLVTTTALGLFGLFTVLNIKRRLNDMRDGMENISEKLDLSQR